MRKPLFAIVGVLVLISVAVGWCGAALDWEWGDVPTWVGAGATVAALAAAGAGAVGVFRQLNALTRQVDLQDEALKLQREQAEADRAEARQREAEARQREERELEVRRAELRAQAERIDISPAKRDFKPQGVNQDVFLALHVENNSPRPIRNVTCRMTINGNETIPHDVARFVETAGGPTAALDRSQYIPVPIMRRNTDFDFLFLLVADLNHGATYRLRFTDDAGLHWELTDDMRLTSIDDRNNW